MKNKIYLKIHTTKPWNNVGLIRFWGTGVKSVANIITEAAKSLLWFCAAFV